MNLPSKRSCIVCEDTHEESIFKESWDVVGLGLIELGYAICKNCGAVYQQPLVPWELMLKHYSQFSNYTNPGRHGKPARTKIENVKRQVSKLNHHVENKGSLLQIGCSDGYTLSEFKKTGWKVSGVDPSTSALKLANERYGISGIVGNFESVTKLGQYDAIVATHVLEHIYEPKSFLEKIKVHLKPEGLLLLEVPCLDRPETWPNGYFTFEHVNYYSEQSLRSALSAAGFEIIDINITNEWVSSTVICVVAKPTTTSSVKTDKNEYLRARSIVDQYVSSEHRRGWGRIEKEIIQNLKKYKSICIWGAGIHTSQLLAKTSLDTLNISTVVDMDAQKAGHVILDIHVQHPSKVEWKHIDAIIISTFSNEREVYKSTEEARKNGTNVYCLYHSMAGEVYS